MDGTATYVKLVHKKVDEEDWDTVAGAYRRHEKEDDAEQKIKVSTPAYNKHLFFELSDLN